MIKSFNKFFESSSNDDIISKVKSFLDSNELWTVNAREMVDEYNPDDETTTLNAILFDTSILEDYVKLDSEYLLIIECIDDENSYRNSEYYIYKNGEFEEVDLFDTLEEMADDGLYLGETDNEFSYSFKDWCKDNDIELVRKEPESDAEEPESDPEENIDDYIERTNRHVQDYKGFQADTINRNNPSSKSDVDNKTDELLDKINKDGIDSLTDKEREMLNSLKDDKGEETLDKINNEKILDDFKIGTQQDLVFRNGPFKITVDVYRDSDDKFELTDTSHGWSTAIVNKKQMLDIYNGKLSRYDLDWE